MSGISRLLKWAPCLWALTRLASNSGSAQRSQILNANSGPQHPSGASDLLNTLSFPARTIVRHSHVVRPSLAARSPSRDPSPVSELEQNRGNGLTLRYERHHHSQGHTGWRWVQPRSLPIQWGRQAVAISPKILNDIRCVSFASPLPLELERAILLMAYYAGRRPRKVREEDIRLVCKRWNEILRKPFWKRRWLNLRPRVAQWPLIGERLQALARNADVIKKVKLEGTLTDIPLTSLEEALRECPAMNLLIWCRLEQIKVGRLDTVNEILLKQVLWYHQRHIRHFGFRLEDAILFLGRPSLFAHSKLLLPEVRRITIDISKSDEALQPGDRRSNSVELVSNLIAELVGTEDRERETRFELRLFCMPKATRLYGLQIAMHSIHLADQIFRSIRELMQNVQGIRMVASFQGPWTSQDSAYLNWTRIWARDNAVTLLDIRASR